jgi:histo-blood group ABO system transferase
VNEACLISVVSGKVYEDYAEQLFESAHRHLRLAHITVQLPGYHGWPDATLYRYHTVLDYADGLTADYLFLIDADMRFEADVGEEILGRLTATQHPGYVNGEKPPYEDRPESAACVRKGRCYYAGGFVGGERQWFLAMAQKIVWQIDQDISNGILARWHDESHLNRVLAAAPPEVTLSPAYCMPYDASGYPWLKGTERKLVALDKTPAERRGR